MAALKPLTVAFGDMGPPEKVRLYVERLANVSIPALRRGVESLLDSYDKRAFPAIADILKASCESPAPRESVGTAKFSDSLAQQDRDDMRAATDHASRVLNSTMGSQAKSEGWDLSLRRFIVDAALAVSAMRRKRAVPFNEVTLLNSLHVNVFCKVGSDDELKRRREDMLRHLQHVAATGAPITVPNHLIEEWRPSTRRAAA